MSAIDSRQEEGDADRGSRPGPPVTANPGYRFGLSSKVALKAILPPGVETVECGSELTGSLLPGEAAVVAAAGELRRREFARGRTCARRALAQLGRPATALLPGSSRQPLWPAGVVGSITHCSGFCAAAVADASRWRTIGIDAEIHAGLPGGVLNIVARAEERQWIHRMPRGPIRWDCVLFSAKESVFKAWFPLTGTWLDFADVLVSFDETSAMFRGRVLRGGSAESGGQMEFEGRYAVSDGRVHTAIACPRSGAFA